MPDSSDNYQLPSWPPTRINRELWNAVMGSIGERLIAREALEADFEALIAQGTQASLDYIQATVAPQIATIQASIELAQEQINQIIVDGIAPNAAKLGGQLPAYYATAASVTAANAAIGLRATTVYVDAELLELATAVQAVLDQKASLTQLGLKADQSLTISAAGLASGGGNLSGNRTITVTKATDAESSARVRDDVAVSPKGAGLAASAALAEFGRADVLINFNGQGATSIRYSKNVASIEDLGVGRFKINFLNPAPHANYVVACGGRIDTGTDDRVPDIGIRRGTVPTTTSLQIQCTEGVSSAFDCDYITVAIFW